MNDYYTLRSGGHSHLRRVLALARLKPGVEDRRRPTPSCGLLAAAAGDRASGPLSEPALGRRRWGSRCRLRPLQDGDRAARPAPCCCCCSPAVGDGAADCVREHRAVPAGAVASAAGRSGDPVWRSAPPAGRLVQQFLAEALVLAAAGGRARACGARSCLVRGARRAQSDEQSAAGDGARADAHGPRLHDAALSALTAHPVRPAAGAGRNGGRQAAPARPRTGARGTSRAMRSSPSKWRSRWCCSRARRSCVRGLLADQQRAARLLAGRRHRDAAAADAAAAGRAGERRALQYQAVSVEAFARFPAWRRRR